MLIGTKVALGMSKGDQRLSIQSNALGGSPNLRYCRKMSIKQKPETLCVYEEQASLRYRTVRRARKKTKEQDQSS